jgi:hypothetical protein
MYVDDGAPIGPVLCQSCYIDLMVVPPLLKTIFFVSHHCHCRDRLSSVFCKIWSLHHSPDPHMFQGHVSPLVSRCFSPTSTDNVRYVRDMTDCLVPGWLWWLTQRQQSHHRGWLRVETTGTWFCSGNTLLWRRSFTTANAGLSTDCSVPISCWCVSPLTKRRWSKTIFDLIHICLFRTCPM